MSNSKGRILVVRGGNLAEFILTCPVFAALRAQFPETEIEVLGYPRFAELAKTAGLINDVRSIETRAAAGFFARNATLDDNLSDYFAKFSVIFSYLYDPDGIFQMNVCKVSAAQFIQGRARPDEGATLHACETFLKPLERFAIFDADAVPRLSISHRTTASQPTIVIHPNPETGAGAWPEAKWRDLALVIMSKTSARVMFIGDEAHARTLERMIADLPAKRATVLNAAVPELTKYLGGCQLFVGHDSGVSHFAAALGIPCVVVWGNSNATLWKPRGEHVTVLKNRAGAVGVTQEEVLAALGPSIA